MNEKEMNNIVGNIIDFLFKNSEKILNNKIIEITQQNNKIYSQSYAGFSYNNKSYVPDRRLTDRRLGVGIQVLSTSLQKDFLDFFDYIDYKKDKKQIHNYLNSLLKTLPEKHKFFGLLPKIIVNDLGYNFIEGIDYKSVLKDHNLLMKQYNYVMNKINFYIAYNIFGN